MNAAGRFQRQSQRQWRHQRADRARPGGRGLGALLGTALAFGPGTGLADVVLDPSFSSETVAAGEYAPGLTTDFLIRESYGERSGNNLYHRFSQFDLAAGESATFIEDAPGSGITRVFAHVSGAASYLDGTLRSTIPGASLYFFNPRGVVYGPNAQLDVLGAFYSSTADRVRFSDGDLFGEGPGASTVTLSAAAPSAWGFLSAAPAATEIQGASLIGAEGETLSFSAGDLLIEGTGATGTPTLEAASGRIELIAVAAPGEVEIDSASAPDLSGFAALGDIQLTDGARLDVSGTAQESIVIRGGRLIAEDAAFTANHTGAANHTGRAIDFELRDLIQFGDEALGRVATLESLVTRAPGLSAAQDGGTGGDIRLVADRIELSGEGSGAARTLISVGNACSSGACLAADQPTGAGGTLSIEADSFALRNGAWILSQSNGPGRGSPIDIEARVVSIGNDAAAAPGTPTFIGSGNFGSAAGGTAPDQDAAGGTIRVMASEQLLLENGGQISSQASGGGRGGDLILEAGRFETRVTNPDLRANGLPASERSLIVTTSTGANDSGAIRIAAGSDVQLEYGEVFSEISGPGPGQPGAIEIEATSGEIALIRNSAVTIRTRDAAGRPITLTSDRLQIRESSIVQSFSEGDGQAGDVQVRARDVLVSGGRGAISPSSIVSRPIGSLVTGTGAGGTIRIDGERLRLEDGALILLSSRESGAAGDLVVGGDAPLASVELDDARIETDNNAAGSSGGSVSIRAQQIRLANGSRISAVNRDIALPGRIELEGRDLRVESGSVITSASDGSTGVGGDIAIRVSETSLFSGARVTTDAAGADLVNQGGNINIASSVLVLANSQIEADAPAGAGGNIEIVAGRFVQSADSRITASGQSPALAGVVRVVSTETNTVDTVAREPRLIEDVSRRLASGCEGRTDAKGSLFLLPQPVRPPPGELGPLSDPSGASSCGRSL